MTNLEAEWLRSDGTQLLFKLFADAGHQLFGVGGCVRNVLLNEPVSDIDMATNATPNQVVDIAHSAGLKNIPTGIEHGTVTVLVKDVPFEITTFRTDVATDGRHATVAFSDSIEEDAKRRDFTMNALYVSPDGAIHDTVGGLADIRSRRVRFIGDASDRIAEDHLRILRFFRFHAWYGLPDSGIDADGLAACAQGADGLQQLSRERIGAEMRKLLSAPNPAPAIASMAQAGILWRVMPGAEVAALAVLVHFEAETKPDWIRRALVLGGEDIADAWRLSKAETRSMSQARADIEAQTGTSEIAYRHGADHARNVTLVRAASVQQPPTATLEQQIEAASKARFPITAADLMPSYEGPALGDKLKALEALWISSGFTLTRNDLLKNDG